MNKQRIFLLVAVLVTGELCEAEMSYAENLERAKSAVVANYGLDWRDIKEWRVE